MPTFKTLRTSRKVIDFKLLGKEKEEVKFVETPKRSRFGRYPKEVTPTKDEIKEKKFDILRQSKKLLILSY